MTWAASERKSRMRIKCECTGPGDSGTKAELKSISLSQEMRNQREMEIVKVHRLCSCYCNDAISILPGRLILGAKADMRWLHAVSLAEHDWCKEVPYMYRQIEKDAHCRTSPKEKLVEQTGGYVPHLSYAFHQYQPTGKRKSTFHFVVLSLCPSSLSHRLPSPFLFPFLHFHLSSLPFNILHIPTPWRSTPPSHSNTTAQLCTQNGQKF